MHMFANVAVTIVAILHFVFLVLEMFLWTTPFGRRTFGLTKELAEGSRALAANQGLYNGFLGAGLVWSLLRDDPYSQMFFLACVVVAGIFGAITAKRSILFVQALPGAIAAVAVILGHR